MLKGKNANSADHNGNVSATNMIGFCLEITVYLMLIVQFVRLLMLQICTFKLSQHMLIEKLAPNSADHNGNVSGDFEFDKHDCFLFRVVNKTQFIQRLNPTIQQLLKKLASDISDVFKC